MIAHIEYCSYQNCSLIPNTIYFAWKPKYVLDAYIHPNVKEFEQYNHRQLRQNHESLRLIDSNFAEMVLVVVAYPFQECTDLKHLNIHTDPDNKNLLSLTFDHLVL